MQFNIIFENINDCSKGIKTLRNNNLIFVLHCVLSCLSLKANFNTEIFSFKYLN